MFVNHDLLNHIIIASKINTEIGVLSDLEINSNLMDLLAGSNPVNTSKPNMGYELKV